MTHSAPPSRLARLRQVTGLDFHVFVTLLSRGWSVLAGAGTVVLLPLHLSSTEQGFYYTFVSLLGLQVLFELGLGQVIIQLVSHESAHLTPTADQRLEGDATRLDHLGSLMQLLRRWYLVAALLFGGLGGVTGGLFLAHRDALPPEQWVGPWAVMMFCTAVNLTYVPALAMFEGCGQIGQVARLRLVQSVIGYTGLWTGLLSGAGLWSACFVPLAATLSTGFWLAYLGRLYQWLLQRVVRDAQRIAWRRDVLPFQWRIAVSAASGYFIFYSFTPLIFANRGPAEAGQFGIAMAVFNALSAVGTSWVYAKTPAMAMYISLGERKALDALFKAVTLRSVLFTTVAAAGIVGGAMLLTWTGLPLMRRIAGSGVLACLAVVCVANCLISAFAAYMRAHREEPMLSVSLVGGIATTLVAWLGSRSSLLTTSMLYAALTSLVLLPWTFLLFRRYSRRTT